MGSNPTQRTKFIDVLEWRNWQPRRAQAPVALESRESSNLSFSTKYLC